MSPGSCPIDETRWKADHKQRTLFFLFLFFFPAERCRSTLCLLTIRVPSVLSSFVHRDRTVSETGKSPTGRPRTFLETRQVRPATSEGEKRNERERERDWGENKVTQLLESKRIREAQRIGRFLGGAFISAAPGGQRCAPFFTTSTLGKQALEK